MREQQELITISELSQKLKVPVSWIYTRTRQRGENPIPVTKVGKYLRFNYDEVTDWLQGKQNG